MQEPTIWKLEQDLWTGGAARFSAELDDGCLVALPPPVGILAGRPAIVESIAGAPRWTSVAMTEREMARPDDGLVVLAYRAEAHRGDDVYRAYCSSSYHRGARGWRLVQHQQTPI
jgi:hypothetical protein